MGSLIIAAERQRRAIQRDQPVADRGHQRKTEVSQTLDHRALKFIVGKVVKFAGGANFRALDAMASEHADFFDCRLRRRELAVFLPFFADFIVPFDQLFLRDLLGKSGLRGNFVADLYYALFDCRIVRCTGDNTFG